MKQQQGEAMYYYRVYGINLATEEYIEALPQIPPPSVVDTYIYFWQSPKITWESTPLLRGKPEYDNEEGIPYQAIYLSENGQYRKLAYRDYINFIISNDGQKLYVEAVDPNIKQNTYLGFFLGAGLGYTLYMKNIPTLHGSVVDVDGNAIAFVGQSTAGKSTTATSIAQLGYPIMNDDLIPLFYNPDEQLWRVAPGYTRMKLWEDASRVLNQKILAPIVEDVPKHYVAIERFQTDSRPLKTIFLLQGRSAELTQPSVEQLSKQKALMYLMVHGYFYTFYETRMKHRLFNVLGQITKQANIFSVIMPHNLDTLRDSVEILLNYHQQTL